MLENYLVEQNLHWVGRRYQSGVERELLAEVLKLLDIDHILAISGVRRCGKSFLLKQIINKLLDKAVPPENILLINFDFPAFSGRPAEEILSTIVDEYRRIKQPQGKLYLFFDEIQTVSKWEIWVKYQYDLHKGSMKFFITGSNSALLSSEYASGLTGRLVEKQLFPFSFAEFLTFHAIDINSSETIILNSQAILNRFDLYLNYGAMPEVVEQTENEIKIDLISTYFNTIIYKDIAGRFGVRDTLLLKDIALYLLGQFSNPINLKKVASQFSTARDTVRGFFKYLESSYFIFNLSRFSFSHKTQLLSQKKTYAVDNGFSSVLPVRFTPDKGRLLEQVVFVELKRRHSNVFYYRNQKECDFIIYDYRRESDAYQVCYGLNENNRQREVKGLVAGCREVNINQGTILTWNQTDEFNVNGIHISVIPVWKWLLQEP
ncbi:MAG: ATP-binding protein [Candidatus Neomarinimicrobiota bacterium]|nr:MAG: ATP-binding protein [Candidatus Neomarinimicrobiota bacterium]